MSWEERPLEKYVEWLIKSQLGERGRDMWGKYVSTRTEVVSEILPWIASQATDLTDHGVNHIQDVIDRAAELLGIENHFVDDSQRQKFHDFSPTEMYVLLSGLLFHDVGNILGRNKHNQKIGHVWSKLPIWSSWPDNDRNIIIQVGRAHSGLSPEGSEDTLKPLSISQEYFAKQPVRLAHIAAVIRFADELAEGPQRTSKMLIANGLFAEGSKLYHHYAQITQVSVDRSRGRVALSFIVNTDNTAYPEDVSEKREHLTALLKVAYSRSAKMNKERQFTRHYADVLVPFKETSISLLFQKDGLPLDISLTPITLNDFSYASDLDGLIETMDSMYSAPALIEAALGK